MTTTGVASSSNGTQLKSRMSELKAEDFIKMMITQLQNQDPMEPAKNSELLAQMSQIGQLQSSTQLQESLKGIVLQSQLGSAGNLIGKMVQGLDAKNETVKGVVNSIRIEKDTVHLELENGKSLALSRVTQISPAPGDAVAGAGADAGADADAGAGADTVAGADTIAGAA